MTDDLKVVDVPRRRKRSLTETPDTESRLTAYCPTCRMITAMVKPKRKDSNGVAITTGKCAGCKRETYRVGASKEGAGE